MRAVSEEGTSVCLQLCMCVSAFSIFPTKSRLKNLKITIKTYWQLKHHILPTEYVLNFLNKGAQHIFAVNDVVW